MTRGRAPEKALDAAMPVAESRGCLLQFVDEPSFVCDYLVLTADRLCAVWVKRTRRIWCSPEELEAQCEAIDRYRRAAGPAFLSREVWFWSPYGTFRFFRIEPKGIVEIDRNGMVKALPLPP